ncbi:MAG: metalloregulator ArsR/SmtB family transcription factor [Candidatus Margulisbacteria bacterium]|nr:metalloregulator ArsR/SmtB family transcription factor [Candidatus Margulisiibacteriota bacterium]
MDKCEELSEVLKVLGNPVRLRVLKQISGVECCVSEIEQKLNLPQSTVSQHLSVLKRMGIVKPIRQHKEVTYILVNDFVKDLLELCCKYS